MKQTVMGRFFSIAISLLVLSASLFSQDLEGNYKNQSDSLLFSNGKVIFNISGFGALFTTMVGEGDYERIENWLLINTGEYSGEKTTHQSMNGNSRDSIAIQITSIENYPIGGAMAEFTTKSGKVAQRLIAAEDGKIHVPRNSKWMKNVAKVRISQLGYDEIAFDCTGNRDHLVKLVKNNVVENKTIVFNVQEEEDETLAITLLSMDFAAGKDRVKSLQKIGEKAKKKNVLSKRYKKEYVPYFRR